MNNGHSFSGFLSSLLPSGLSRKGDPAALNGRFPDNGTPEPDGWNDTRREYPRHQCIHHVIRDQAARTPDAVAAVFEREAMTYGELENRAEKLAAQLRALGAGPGNLVGICMERSLEMLVGLLAILKSGAAYVPLDPSYPRERLAGMLEDSQVPLLLTQHHLAGMFPAQHVRLLFPGEEWIGSPPFETPSAPFDSENLAYVLYTSGSTGKPKGVMVTHRNVLNFFAGMDEILGCEPGVWLAVTSISFDISVLELFWTLARGFKVVIVSENARVPETDETRGVARDYSLPAQALLHGATHLQCTPSFARMLTCWPEALQALRPLRALLIGGEALTGALAARLRPSFSGRILNMYGPTETTVWSTVWDLSGEESETSVVPIGRPIANTRVFLVGPDLQPVPAGAVGELCIGGDGLARGYWKRPELTAEKFVAAPFQPGERLYRTGDLARRRPDGTLEFLGRTDHQVKIRGHRVELGEIESVMALHSGVRECVVTVRPGLPEEPQVVAYVVLMPPPPEPAALRAFLRRKLPAHMIPAAFVPLDVLPLTPNGKIDRAALPAPQNLPSRPAALAAPKPALEPAVAAIWRNVLGIEDPGMSESFFDLGGHSLQMVRVQALLKEELGIDVPLLELFRNPTIRSLARFLGGEEPASPSPGTTRERPDVRRSAAVRKRAHCKTAA
jgi:amino acid adenylation domain-containing protein